MAKKPSKASKTKGNHQVFGGLFLLAVIFATVILVYNAYNWMVDTQRLPFARLAVKGELTHVTPELVRDQLISGEPLGNFMTQDIDALQKRIEDMPWVEHAAVGKRWPDLIQVQITEHKAGAIWNGTDLLDVDGNVFKGDPSLVSQDLPKLFGPDIAGSEVLQVWFETKAQLSQIGRQMDALILNDRNAWQIILDNGIRLELGKDSRKERLGRFIKLYRYLGDKVDQISYIDLRYDIGAAVGWLSDEKLTQESK